MPEFPEVRVRTEEFSAKEYGSIVLAVEACKEAGGGRVIVEPGLWQTGPLHLGSNMCLYLEAGA